MYKLWLCTSYTRGKYWFLLFSSLHLCFTYFKFETCFQSTKSGKKKECRRVESGADSKESRETGPYLNNRVVRREGDAEIRGSVSRSWRGIWKSSSRCKRTGGILPRAQRASRSRNASRVHSHPMSSYATGISSLFCRKQRENK